MPFVLVLNFYTKSIVRVDFLHDSCMLVQPSDHGVVFHLMYILQYMVAQGDLKFREQEAEYKKLKFYFYFEKKKKSKGYFLLICINNFFFFIGFISFIQGMVNGGKHSILYPIYTEGTYILQHLLFHFKLQKNKFFSYCTFFFFTFTPKMFDQDNDNV